jgi:probable HAF family extracellular repeat protein
MTDLGTLPGGNLSGATGINDSGTVVGWADEAAPGYSGAFIYSNGTMTSLATLGGSSSYAYGINDSGTVVGEADTVASYGYAHAFSYSDGTMADLNSLTTNLPAGFVLVRANAINNLGDIVGYGGYPQGTESEAFLLTPVPEPTGASLLALGIAGMFGMPLLKRRRRTA